jgi:hypothetical protein
VTFIQSEDKMPVSTAFFSVQHGYALDYTLISAAGIVMAVHRCVRVLRLDRMNGARRGVIVIGSVCDDLLMSLPRLPGPGETVAGGHAVHIGGGKPRTLVLAWNTLDEEATRFRFD